MRFVYTVVYKADYMVCGTFSTFSNAQNWIYEDITDGYTSGEVKKALIQKYKDNYVVIQCELDTDNQREIDMKDNM